MFDLYGREQHRKTTERERETDREREREQREGETEKASSREKRVSENIHSSNMSECKSGFPIFSDCLTTYSFISLLELSFLFGPSLQLNSALPSKQQQQQQRYSSDNTH